MWQLFLNEGILRNRKHTLFKGSTRGSPCVGDFPEIRCIWGRKLKLQCFAIVLYTPCNDTKYASGELARLLTEAELPVVQLHRFASKGLSKGHENFTVISAGDDSETRTKVHSIFVDGRTSAPDLRCLLQLIDNFSPPLNPVRVVEFGGFDADDVRKAYSSKEQ
ncbi:hypothetical protein Y032_0731g1899 [Ancylostoma ceylanicum]|nr:hypothetical protein Y032_0731g1899 [Ancylostoma ceylanicum]